ncbi:hypothetical protein HAX54_002573, partial [Datura stramonium]|nr:hypothetical protein [Datura stramonium]
SVGSPAADAIEYFGPALDFHPLRSCNGFSSYGSKYSKYFDFLAVHDPQSKLTPSILHTDLQNDHYLHKFHNNMELVGLLLLAPE